MDAFELLKSDHEKVSKLFEEIEAASGQTKRQIFTRLKGELDVHASIEEKVLYPALENTDEAREITLEAYEEHKVVKGLLAELAAGGGPDDEWDAKLTVLKENVEHHVEEEEGELFSKARKALSSKEIDRIGLELEAEKVRQQGGAGQSPQDLRPAKQQTGKASGSQKGSSGRASSKGANKGQSAGVLARIAKFIGLGNTSTAKGTKKTSKSSKAGKSAGSKTSAASRTSSASKSTKSKPARSTVKSATKKGGSKSGGAVKTSSKLKRAGKTKAAKAATKARTSGANQRRPSSTSSKGVASKRGATKKPAPRAAASKKGQGRGSTKRRGR